MISLTVDEPGTDDRSVRRSNIVDWSLGTVQHIRDGHHVAYRCGRPEILKELAAGGVQALLPDLLVLLLHDRGLNEKRVNVGRVSEVPSLLDTGKLDCSVEESRVLLEAVEAEDITGTTKSYRQLATTYGRSRQALHGAIANATWIPADDVVYAAGKLEQQVLVGVQ